MKRGVSPTRSSEDLAEPAVFLVSELSVHVTGHIIMADGGYSTV
jgi:enoyl-[acyl-carrier-protein] reductase (NADH)